MHDVLGQILSADDYTWTIAIVLTICASAIVYSMLSSWIMTALYAPALLAAAMTGAWLMRTFLLLPGSDHTIGVIIGTSAGMTLSLLPLFVLTRLAGAFHDLVIRAPTKTDIYIRSAPPKKPIAIDRTV